LWSPKIVGKLNDSYIKLAKPKGEFVWQHHANEYELFVVVKGGLLTKLCDRALWLNEDEFVILPQSVEHCPTAADTGNVQIEKKVRTTKTLSNCGVSPHEFSNPPGAPTRSCVFARTWSRVSKSAL